MKIHNKSSKQSLFIVRQFWGIKTTTELGKNAIQASRKIKSKSEQLTNECRVTVIHCFITSSQKMQNIIKSVF